MHLHVPQKLFLPRFQSQNISKRRHLKEDTRKTTSIDALELVGKHFKVSYTLNLKLILTC